MKIDKVTDFAGGTNFVVLAVLVFALAGTHTTRQCVATACVVAWGVRLSGYLLYRICVIGEDKRFDGTRENCLAFLVFWVFQMVWVWTVSLPVTFLNATTNPLVALATPFGSARDVVGCALFGVGLAVEAVSDQQKFAFCRAATGPRRWCDVGLWRWSRHPNYFGEMLVWWGLFCLASSTFEAARVWDATSWGYATCVGPLFTMAILLLFSGMPLLERKAAARYAGDADYAAYRAAPVYLGEREPPAAVKREPSTPVLYTYTPPS